MLDPMEVICRSSLDLLPKSLALFFTSVYNLRPSTKQNCHVKIYSSEITNIDANLA